MTEPTAPRKLQSFQLSRDGTVSLTPRVPA
jgi:hypothetical protein